MLLIPHLNYLDLQQEGSKLKSRFVMHVGVEHCLKGAGGGRMFSRSAPVSTPHQTKEEGKRRQIIYMVTPDTESHVDHVRNHSEAGS